MSFIGFGIALIKTSSTGVLQSFGKFSRTLDAGLHLYVPFIQRIDTVSNRLRQSDFKFEVKTKDNVFAILDIAVQHTVLPEDTEKAFYSLSNYESQTRSYIENVVRAQVPKMSLDQLFESQDQISQDVSENLQHRMKQYGYTIEKTLITSVEPDHKVKQAMNEINASLRLKEAVKHKADAEYISRVREAEADKDRKRLQGEGMSQQRLAILSGYKIGVSEMASSLGLTPKDVIDFVMSTQHLDTIETIGKSQNCKTIFLNHQPKNRLIEDIVAADEVKSS